MVNIILHGVMGPIEVKGKVYESMMPAQGAQLNDAQIAAVSNYLRSNFGNNEKRKISPNVVKKLRERFKKQEMPWEPIELLKIYPLEGQEIVLNIKEIDVKYSGNSQTHQFSGSDIDSRIIDFTFKKDPKRGRRHITYRGTVKFNKNGKFTFFLGSDYGVSIKINDKKIIHEMEGTGLQIIKKGLKQQEGEYPLEVIVQEHQKSTYMNLTWREDKGKKNKYSLTSRDNSGPRWMTIKLEAKDEVLVYRNYIKGVTSSRPIGVAFPSGANFAFDADLLAPAIYWNGDFINAGRHWTSRGGGEESPMSKDAIQNYYNTVWGSKPPTRNFLGYEFTDQRQGIKFIYQINHQTIEDKYTSTKKNTLTRETTLLDGPPLPMELWSLAGEFKDNSLITKKGTRFTCAENSQKTSRKQGKETSRVTLEANQTVTTLIEFKN